MNKLLLSLLFISSLIVLPADARPYDRNGPGFYNGQSFDRGFNRGGGRDFRGGRRDFWRGDRSFRGGRRGGPRIVNNYYGGRRFRRDRSFVSYNNFNSFGFGAPCVYPIGGGFGGPTILSFSF